MAKAAETSEVRPAISATRRCERAKADSDSTNIKDAVQKKAPQNPAATLSMTPTIAERAQAVPRRLSGCCAQSLDAAWHQGPGRGGLVILGRQFRDVALGLVEEGQAALVAPGRARHRPRRRDR